MSGYKQTEVGLIPEDWSVAALGTLIDPSRSIRYGIVQPGRFDPEGRYMVRGQDYSAGWVDPDRLFRVSSDVEERYANARIRAGDILMTIVGANTGRVAVVPEWLEEANLTQTTARVAIDGSKANATFCSYVLSSWYGVRQVQNYIKGGAQPGLNCGDIEKFLIPLPPTSAEQEAIAEAMSATDALIESLVRLVAKRRQIRLGALQGLLSGAKRVPGFEKTPSRAVTEIGLQPLDWDIGPVRRAVEGLEAGASVNSDSDEVPDFESYPCVLKTGAARDGLLNVRESKKVAQRDLWRLRVSLRKDTILVSRMNTPELVGDSAYVGSDYPNLFVPDRMWMITVRSSSAHPRWLSYALTWERVKTQIASSATGTSGSMKNISKPSFLATVIPYPPLDEQKAIAAILAEMDEEIDALRTQIAKARGVRQGMLQELLTGQVRLV